MLETDNLTQVITNIVMKISKFKVRDHQGVVMDITDHLEKF